MKKAYLNKFRKIAMRDMFELNHRLKKGSLETAPFSESEKEEIKKNIKKNSYLDIAADGYSKEKIIVSNDTDRYEIRKYSDNSIYLIECLNQYICGHSTVSYYKMNEFNKQNKLSENKSSPKIKSLSRNFNNEQISHIEEWFEEYFKD